MDGWFEGAEAPSKVNFPLSSSRRGVHPEGFSLKGIKGVRSPIKSGITYWDCFVADAPHNDSRLSQRG
jgi:hypothetical protein